MKSRGGSAHPPRVLFIGFWGAADPLTVATILPGVRLLRDEFGVGTVYLSTMERDEPTMPPPMAGVVHVPWIARKGPKVIARAWDQVGRVRQLIALVRRERVGLIIARTSPAGAVAGSVALRTGVPFVVESFEPHADYMADCGEWRRGGLMYRSLRRMEERTIARAHCLITVAHRYRDHLVARGVDPARVLVAPCPVPLDRFRIDALERGRMRVELDLGTAITGIYVGKFGGLYHRERSFEVFARTHRHFQGRFKLIVLTPEPPQEVLDRLSAAGFPPGDARVSRVAHEQVPAHLNAADIAFALYKRTPSSIFLGPVKIGEYWACGLPVLLTRGVGDDGDLIAGEGVGGALFDPAGDDLPVALDAVMEQMRAADHRSVIRALAERHRSLDHTRAAYASVLASLPQSRR